MRSSGSSDGLGSVRSGVPTRYRTLVLIAGVFLVVNTLMRFGLALLEGGAGEVLSARFPGVLAIGFLYDVAALAYLAAVWTWLAVPFTDGRWGRRAFALFAAIAGLVMLGVFAFVGASEVLFWNEFSARFNFIAVDYLLYTREVVGNIRQSYAMGPILGGLAAAVLVVAAFLGRRWARAAAGPAGPLRRRVVIAAVATVAALASFQGVGEGAGELLSRVGDRELGSNGYYSFARAFRSNDLDYFRFYPTIPPEQALAELDAVMPGLAGHARDPKAHPLQRRVDPGVPEKRWNVVLVTMESLGADFVESLGGKRGLTPNLDRLGREGIRFTQLYATGLRTVRGLEAVTMSLPPTPGHAVPVRVANKGLQTLGGIFRAKGYEALYVYGGYATFDNMADYFGGNGYTVIDRRAIPSDRITHETIWGVADEDLFGQAVREIDARVAAGKPVFAHVMTTSNHRPFTFPDGRIDLKSGSGRDAAVKYSDWSIGELVRRARERPWFDDTVFVFVADHTSHGRGRIDLPPEHYHVPFIIYAPKHLAPRQVDYVASQIDVGPTLLGLLDFAYDSQFFGHDILKDGAAHQRALLANYLTVGYLEGGRVVELTPRRAPVVVDAASGKPFGTADAAARQWVNESIAYYQVAAGVLRDFARSQAAD